MAVIEDPYTDMIPHGTAWNEERLGECIKHLSREKTQRILSICMGSTVGVLIRFKTSIESRSKHLNIR